MPTLDPSCQGTWKLTTDPNVTVTFGPNTYHSSVEGDVPIIVTSPTAFTRQDGNTSFAFQNGTWEGTMIKDVGRGPPGTVYKFTKGRRSPSPGCYRD